MNLAHSLLQCVIGSGTSVDLANLSEETVRLLGHATAVHVTMYRGDLGIGAVSEATPQRCRENAGASRSAEKLSCLNVALA